MRRILKLARVPVLLAAAVIFTVVPVAQSATYLSTTYYNIYYSGSTQYKWALKLKIYLGRAFWAAKTTIGYDARRGKMNIFFWLGPDGEDGKMIPGTQNIYVNRRDINNYTSFEAVGDTVAHESAHVLYYNYTNAHSWNKNLWYYDGFFTESLSWYAGCYVYYYKYYTRSSAYSEIRKYLKYYYAKTGRVMSWYHAGYYYGEGSGNYFEQAKLQLCAIGWFLTDGQLTSSSSYLKKTLSRMRYWSSRAGYYLRSSNYSTARSSFENSFKYGYGRLANAGWLYTGSSNGAYKNTSYLYGLFWYKFYK